MRSPWAVPALMCSAADRNPNVRVAVLRALAEMNDERIYPLLLWELENHTTSLRMADMLLMVGPAISPYLLERCHTLNDPRTQALYVRLLGLLQEPRALDVLLPLAQAADLHLRLEVIVALGAIGDARAVVVLHTALGDLNQQIRAEAAYALGRIGDQASTPALSAQLAKMRKVAVEAMVYLHHACNSTEQCIRSSVLAGHQRW